MSFSFAKKNLLKYIVSVLVVFPVFSLAAEINFSEIMFDPEGSDTDREWIEIKNTSGSAINLEKYKFCDSGSCHKFYESGSGFKIPANSFGIIAKKPDKFKEDYPNFSGFILRASFSLTNSKELLELKNENGDVVSVVEYNVDVGGKDGDTFSLFGDTWKNGKATPNAENIFKDPKKDEEKSNSSGSGSDNDDIKINRTYVEISDVIDGKKKLKAEIIDNIPTLIAGAENEFNGRAYGITGIEIRGAEYFWNFGDGEKEYGKNVKHTFAYPGEYVLTLIVKSANFTGNTRKIVKVVEPNIEIVDVSVDKNWIKLKNNYSDILKLDNWFLFVDGDDFKIPKETYILGNNEVIFSNKITNLDVRENSNIFLLFPDGKKATKYIANNVPVLKNDFSKINQQNKATNVVGVDKKKKKKRNKKDKVKIKKHNSAMHSSYMYNERNFIPNIQNIGQNSLKNNENKPNDRHLSNNKFVEEKQVLHILNERNFVKENIYFLSFVFLIFILTISSYLLNYFERKNAGDNYISQEAREFIIEE